MRSDQPYSRPGHDPAAASGPGPALDPAHDPALDPADVREAFARLEEASRAEDGQRDRWRRLLPALVIVTVVLLLPVLATAVRSL